MARTRKQRPAQATAEKPVVFSQRRLVLLTLLLLAGTVAGVVLWEMKRANDQAAFQTLRGRWLRPDGGYVLLIREATAEGVVTAEYLSPAGPVQVTRAEAKRQGDSIQVHVVLYGSGYQGNNYTLTYDPDRDELHGVYDPIIQDTFPVTFIREKE